MRTLLLRTLFVLLGNVYVLSLRNNGYIRTKEPAGGSVNGTTYGSARAAGRDKAASGFSTGALSADRPHVRTLTLTSTNLPPNPNPNPNPNPITRGHKHHAHRKALSWDPAARRDARHHHRKRDELNSGNPRAARGTAGGHAAAKPPSVGAGGGGSDSDRLKRGTKEEKKTLLKWGRKTLNKSSKPPAEFETAADAPLPPWEPVPRPAQALTATALPPNALPPNALPPNALPPDPLPPDPFTRRTEPVTFPEEDPWDATPMTPPNAPDFGGGGEIRNPFYPVTGETYGAYAIAGVSAAIFLAGVAGNLAILCIVCQNYYMKSISNSLLANLALWDLALIFLCLPLVIFHQLTQSWLLGEFTCRVVPYVEVASLGVTTFTLCALCIDRFRAATNVQMYYEMIENCASTGAKLAVIWVGALLLALPELLIRQLVSEEAEPPGGGEEEEPAVRRCVVRISTSLPDTLYVLGLTYQGARLWWCFGCYFCLPTLFTIGCSLVTARKIRRAERRGAAAGGARNGNRKQIRLESQMNCAVVTLAIVYGACVVPENICNIVSSYMAAGVPERTMALLRLLAQLLLFCRAAATPALLLLLCRPLGRAFLDCCCCCCCRGNASAVAGDDNEHECTTELELSPFSTIRRELSSYTPC